MKLNLGCGSDQRAGYVNVDIVQPCDTVFDISSSPWPWADGSVDEIMMLDVLEHIPYAKTDAVLLQCWRVLARGGQLIVQAPDFMHCSNAVNNNRTAGFLCNFCGAHCSKMEDERCICGKTLEQVQLAAVHRLYGGQDREGNWHYNAFTPELLAKRLMKIGFKDFELVERNENGETFYQNWNFRLRAVKSEELWAEF